jgi:hypothetical protein
VALFNPPTTTPVIPAEAPGPINMTVVQRSATYVTVGVMCPGSAAGVTVEGVMRV